MKFSHLVDLLKTELTPAAVVFVGDLRNLRGGGLGAREQGL